MATSLTLRTRTPLIGIGAGILAAVIALGVYLGSSYISRHDQRTTELTRVAQKVLTLELNLGKWPQTRSLSPASAYRPFDRWLVPKSQAAYWTQWVLNQDLAVAHNKPQIRLAAAHWWTRRVPTLSAHKTYTTVLFNVYWWKKFDPKGESTGTAEVAINLVKTRRGWAVNGIFWDSNPGSGPDQPDSFAYDFDHLAGATVPPQGDPPPLRPRVNNP